MIWAEWTVCTAIGVISWLFLKGILLARYGYHVVVVSSVHR